MKFHFVKMRNGVFLVGIDGDYIIIMAKKLALQADDNYLKSIQVLGHGKKFGFT